MLVYKILIMENKNMLDIDVFTFDKDKRFTERQHYHIADELKRTMMIYIKYNNRLLYYLLRYYIIDMPTLQYPQDCLICVSTKEYTYNFTLDEIKTKNSSLYGEIRKDDENNETKNN